jgi:Tfp pilus assembly PilM family ATPase
MSKDIIAGISVSGKFAQFAVFEVRAKGNKLIHIEEFSNDSGDDLWFLEKILRPEKRFLKKVNKVSVAVDSGSIILHRFPIDTTLNQSEQNDHIHWELSNFIPDYQSKDYIYDLHPLRINSREQIADVLAVAVKREIILKIQEALASNKLELFIADTHFFGAEQSLKINYPEIREKVVALIYAEENHLDVGIEKGGKLVAYGYGLNTSADLIRKIIAEEIQDLVLNEIYCCGPKMTSEIIHLLKNSFEINTIYLNPFRFVETSSVKNLNNFNGRKHLYAACTGVALRK